MNFDELRHANVRRCESKFHKLTRWLPWQWTNALAGEVGEACNLSKKINRLHDAADNDRVLATIKPTDLNVDDLKSRLVGEVADVIIYADLLLASLGVDMGEAVRLTFNRKSEEIGSDIWL